MTANDVLLRVRGLEVRDAAGSGIVRGINLDVRRGECLALVGESGAGKSLTLRALAGLLPRGLEAWGEIDFEGRSLMRALGRVCAGGASSTWPSRR